MREDSPDLTWVDGSMLLLCLSLLPDEDFAGLLHFIYKPDIGSGHIYIFVLELIIESMSWQEDPNNV